MSYLCSVSTFPCDTASDLFNVLVSFTMKSVHKAGILGKSGHVLPIVFPWWNLSLKSIC